VVEFGEWLCEEVLKEVPHRHFVFSIAKILRRYFLYDRKLLSDRSRCAWETLKEIFRHKVFRMLLKKEKITGELVETDGSILRFLQQCGQGKTQDEG
jgi:hypothetical protein